MTTRKHVESLDEWLALPELHVPTDAETNDEGAVYRVLKVGVFAASPEECKRQSLSVEPNEIGKCFLPTTFIEGKDGSRRLCRLPVSLREWAVDVVALAHTGMNPLPCDIRFGVIEEGTYAEMI